MLGWAGRNGILGLLKGEARDAVSCNLLSWSGLAKAGARAGSACHGWAHPNTATALRLRDPVGARLSPSRSNTGYARLPDVPRRNPPVDVLRLGAAGLGGRRGRAGRGGQCPEAPAVVGRGRWW